MTRYIATFFSHFGAVRFAHLCAERDWQAEVRPVPRALSSSCGTCVCFAAHEPEVVQKIRTPELEQLVRDEKGYPALYKAED